ncbi:MAG: thiol-disulfide oxidoreductase DCC family protein [Bacteroidetes bacterium]|nr:thiol-disulfide oxidoreductase DCC family protein [Bacteroidota bacterium]
MNTKETNILLFDGVCNFCNKSVQFIIKRDSSEKFKFASLQSEIGQTLLKKFGLETSNLDSFVYIKNDSYFVKSSAALHVLKELGGIWQLFYFLLIIPKPLRDFVYNFISKRRYQLFGKRDSCMIPTDATKHLFLD